MSDLREVQAQKADFDYGDYVDLGLAMGRQSRQLREAVGIKLGIGYANSKRFYQRLQTFGISLAELKQAVEEAENDQQNSNR